MGPGLRGLSGLLSARGAPSGFLLPHTLFLQPLTSLLPSSSASRPFLEYG